jgi:hypothetical protein
MTTPELLQMVVIFGAVLVAGGLGFMMGRKQGNVAVEDSGDVLANELARLRRRAVARDEELGRLRTEADRQRRRARRV